MKRALGYLLLLNCVLFGAAPCRAHGGEDHGEKPASLASAADGVTSLETASETVEIVLKHGPIRPGEKTALKLFLSAAEDNSPIANAKVDLEIGNIEGFKVEFHAEAGQPGTYHAEAVFPKEGHFDAIISVSSAAVTDLFVIPNISVGDSGTIRDSGLYLWILIPFGLTAAALILVLFRKKSVPRPQGDVKIIAFYVIFSCFHASSVLAHGGEDHGDENRAETTPSTGSVVTMTKESQFLLGVRTQSAKEKKTVATVTALGKISHRSTGQQDLFATTDGRLVVPTTGRVPLVGQEVKKGEILGSLTSIGVIALQAPFDGIVAFSEFHPGQWVTAGTKLFTILDPSLVWVETHVFQKDLPRISKDSKVTVIADAPPDAGSETAAADESHEGIVLNVGQTFDEDTRTALVTIEVKNQERKLNIGGWAKVYIETPQALRAVSVPKSAILKKQGLPVVFVKITAERFEGRVVDPVGERLDEVYLKSGVSDGEKVVKQGNYQLLPFLGNLQTGK